MLTVKVVMKTIDELSSQLAIWEELSNWLKNQIEGPTASPPIKARNGAVVSKEEMTKVLQQIKNVHVEAIGKELDSLETMEVEE